MIIATVVPSLPWGRLCGSGPSRETSFSLFSPHDSTFPSSTRSFPRELQRLSCPAVVVRWTCHSRGMHSPNYDQRAFPFPIQARAPNNLLISTRPPSSILSSPTQHPLTNTQCNSSSIRLVDHTATGSLSTARAPLLHSCSSASSPSSFDRPLRLDITAGEFSTPSPRLTAGTRS